MTDEERVWAALEAALLVGRENPFPDAQHPNPLISVVLSNSEWGVVAAIRREMAEKVAALERERDGLRETNQRLNRRLQTESQEAVKAAMGGWSQKRNAGRELAIARAETAEARVIELEGALREHCEMLKLHPGDSTSCLERGFSPMTVPEFMCDVCRVLAGSETGLAPGTAKEG